MLRRRRKSKSSFLITAAVLIITVAVISALIPDSVWNNIFIKTGLRPPEYQSAPMSVHFVDVGQGDCTVITTDNGETVLIDSGEDIKSDNVINYLSTLSVKKIDYCIVTHPHSDHYGGMKKILSEYPASCFIMPELSKEIVPDDGYYDSLVSFVGSRCENVYYLKENSTFKLNNINLEVFCPVSETSELNNMSLVVRALYNNSAFLIAGDCSEEEEKALLRKYPESFRSDVLKVGHHGSGSATSDGWLDAVSPQMAVISAGKYNSYGHPADETIEKLEQRNIRLYRTDICGTVVFDCNGDGITVNY